MKRITASEARRDWFRILDEVADGEVVVIVRKGRRIMLRREPDRARSAPVPDYGDIIQVPDVERAAEWGWAWTEESDLESTERE